MTRQGTPAGTPSDGAPTLGEVESDFAVPDDADLRPVTHEGDDEGDAP